MTAMIYVVLRTDPVPSVDVLIFSQKCQSKSMPFAPDWRAG